jgi:hypothetical protein
MNMVLTTLKSKNSLRNILVASLFLSSSAFSATNITTCSQLQNISQNLTEQYVLTNDIDCSGFLFKTIGSTSTPFSGVFDGQGYKISNLTINMPTVNNVALFSSTQNAKVYNVQLNNVNIMGGSIVASLIGTAQNTEIKNISANGKVIGKSNSIGGLIGLLKEKSSLLDSTTNINVSLINTMISGNIMGGLVGEVNDSSVDKSNTIGPTNGYSGVGGLIGKIDSGNVTNSYSSGPVLSTYSNGTGGLIGIIQSTQNVAVSYCYATGDIQSSTSSGIGGLIGILTTGSASAPVTVSHCYSSGSITSPTSTNMGGLVGDILGSYSLPSDAIIISDSFTSRSLNGYDWIGGVVGYVGTSFTLLNTYSTGAIVGTSRMLGGLIGGYDYTLPNKGNIVSSYWDMQTSGITSPTCGFNTTPLQCGVGKTTAEMYAQSTYVGWDFVNNWSIKENQSYPLLIGVN